MSNITTTRKLKSALKYWQKELRLLGWDIEARFVKPEDMALPAADAETESCLTNHSVMISIVRPKYNSRSTLQRLLHEMLHIRTPLYPKDKIAQDIFEAGIDATAEVLCCQHEALELLRKKYSEKST